MKPRILYFIAYYCYWVLLFVVQKPIFMLFQWEHSKDFGRADFFSVIGHGLPMDLSTAGYISLPVFLLLLVSCFFGKPKWLGGSIKAVTAVLLAVVVVGCVADMFLYTFWGYRLDITPLFYMESPKNAAASGTMAQNVGSVLCVVAEYAVFWLLFRFIHRMSFRVDGRSVLAVLPFVAILAVLVVVIRGGVTVSVMNAGRVYFSQHMFLNHAAINPLWNFMNSFKKEDLKASYRFMDDVEAHVLFDQLNADKNLPADTLVLNNKRPNIVIFIQIGRAHV